MGNASELQPTDKLAPNAGLEGLSAFWKAHVLRTDNADPGSLRRDALDRAFGRLVVLRFVAAPVLAGLMATFMFFDPTPWRRYLLGIVAVTLLTISVVELLAYRKKGVGALRVAFNMLVMGLGQLCFVLATGGLFSPIVPALVAFMLVTSALAERRTALALLLLVEVPALWLMAFVHTQGVFVDTLMPTMMGDASGLERTWLPWAAATVYSVMMVVTTRVGAEGRGIFENLLAERLRERDRVLSMHAEQSRALTTLSAEIAHELKNPLASVKGLSALVARDLEGKAEERMAVLRREVDRMQGILDEFLNFSRPLVPLTIEETNVKELAGEIAQLHEGTALNRAVGVVVTGEPATVRCDPRKIRQILINLVQNALDASTQGSMVELRVEDDGEQVRVTVLDRGPGLSEELRERIFDAGVTDKAKGSGLGLAVARSLARQHDGELVLHDREGGGVSAELTLPKHRASLELEPMT